MKSIGEFFSLLPLFLTVRFRTYREERRVRQRFYGNASLKKCDLALQKAYKGLNPYRICKEFLKLKGEKELDVYGETPLTTLALLAQKCNITSKDTLLELGSGRGRASFFLSNHTRCKVLGIEWVPFFVERAKEIAKDHCPNAEFLCADVSSVDFTGASIIYLAGTCFSDELLAILSRSFDKLKPGTKVITVSFPITDYCSSFVVKEKFNTSFFWGKTEIYLQEKVKPTQ